MQKFLAAGKYVFPLSFLMYVGLHLGKPEVGAAFVPDYLPFPLLWNYMTMVFILMFIVSAVVEKLDGLAYSLMALYVVLMALLVHLPRALGQELGAELMATNVAQAREMEMVNVFRNLMVAAALMGYARFIARDKRFIGS